MNRELKRAGSPTRRILAAVAGGMLVAGGAVAQGSENLALARVFGSGVHAYFSGDFLRSYEDLSAVVEAGSQDPRTLYFRGLSALRLGRFDEAEADFSRGADLEATAVGNWPVARSLERVQGADRIRLERHRARARAARVQQTYVGEQKMFSQIKAAQGSVLRERIPAPAPREGEPGTFDRRPTEAVPAPNDPATEPGAGTAEDAGAGADPRPETEPAPNPPDVPAGDPVDAGSDAGGADDSGTMDDDGAGSAPFGEPLPGESDAAPAEGPDLPPMDGGDAPAGAPVESEMPENAVDSAGLP